MGVAVFEDFPSVTGAPGILVAKAALSGLGMLFPATAEVCCVWNIFLLGSALSLVDQCFLPPMARMN